MMPALTNIAHAIGKGVNITQHDAGIVIQLNVPKPRNLSGPLRKFGSKIANFGPACAEAAQHAAQVSSNVITRAIVACANGIEALGYQANVAAVTTAKAVKNGANAIADATCNAVNTVVDFLFGTVEHNKCHRVQAAFRFIGVFIMPVVITAAVGIFYDYDSIKQESIEQWPAATGTFENVTGFAKEQLANVINGGQPESSETRLATLLQYKCGDHGTGSLVHTCTWIYEGRIIAIGTQYRGNSPVPLVKFSYTCIAEDGALMERYENEHRIEYPLHDCIDVGLD